MNGCPFCVKTKNVFLHKNPYLIVSTVCKKTAYNYCPALSRIETNTYFCRKSDIVVLASLRDKFGWLSNNKNKQEIVCATKVNKQHPILSQFINQCVCDITKPQIWKNNKRMSCLYVGLQFPSRQYHKIYVFCSCLCFFQINWFWFWVWFDFW